MKRIIIWRVSFLFVVLLLSSVSAFAQKQTVKDYFQKIIKTENAYSLLRDNQPKYEVVDTKNGYLRVTGAFEGWYEAALFRRTSGNPLVLIAETFCGPACGSDVKAFEISNGKASDVTSDVVPDLKEDELMFKLRARKNDFEAEFISAIWKLPRKGKTIKVNNDEDGTHLYDLEFNGIGFRVKRDVLDYYFLSPESAYDNPNPARTKINMIDRKNGYLSLRDGNKDVEAAIFRRSDGRYLLVVAETVCSGPSCSTNRIQGYLFTGSLLEHVTESIFPSFADLEDAVKKQFPNVSATGIVYKIPQKGTTITIRDGKSAKKLRNLIWRNDKFVSVGD